MNPAEVWTSFVHLNTVIMLQPLCDHLSDTTIKTSGKTSPHHENAFQVSNGCGVSLNYQHPCTKIHKNRENALLIPAIYLGTIYGFFLVSFDEMQKLLQGQKSYVYREIEYNRFFSSLFPPAYLDFSCSPSMTFSYRLWLIPWQL